MFNDVAQAFTKREEDDHGGNIKPFNSISQQIAEVSCKILLKNRHRQLKILETLALDYQWEGCSVLVYAELKVYAHRCLKMIHMFSI